MMVQALDFAVRKDNFQDTKLVEKTYSDDLEVNQVLLKVDTFSLTSNNITYAVLGEQMNYWQFFPTEEGYGIIPAWGFADVLLSNHPEVQVGQRFYGYYPMGSHLLVKIDKASPLGFVDRTEHRKGLASVYNFYSNTTSDQSYSSETETHIAIFRPLFVTSFLIDYHLAEEKFFEASQIVITSASSKTAHALAFLLAQRKEEHKLKLIGLTSKRNKEFVKELGWYDQTVSYADLNELNSNGKFIVVDFTGNHDTQYKLQTILEENLVYNCLVGLVDWKHLRGEKPLPKKGDIFFAPTHADKRQQELGTVGFQQKVGMAWQQFISSAQSSLKTKQHIGMQELEKLYLEMQNGNIDPRHGHMVRLK